MLHTEADCPFTAPIHMPSTASPQSARTVFARSGRSDKDTLAVTRPADAHTPAYSDSLMPENNCRPE